MKATHHWDCRNCPQMRRRQSAVTFLLAALHRIILLRYGRESSPSFTIHRIPVVKQHASNYSTSTSGAKWGRTSCLGVAPTTHANVLRSNDTTETLLTKLTSRFNISTTPTHTLSCYPVFKSTDIVWQWPTDSSVGQKQYQWRRGDCIVNKRSCALACVWVVFLHVSVWLSE
jgi:hypothetical protein